MGNGAQKLHGVTLRLQGEITGGGAFHIDGGSLDLEGLLAAGGQLQGAADDEGGTDVDFGDLLEIFDGVVIHHLHGAEIGTVVEHDEAKLLGGAAIAHPATDGHFLTGIGIGVFEKLTNGNQFHGKLPRLFL